MLLHCLTVGYFPYAMNWKPGQELRFPDRYWRKYKETGLTELITACLQFDPKKRISAAEALESNWILG